MPSSHAQSIFTSSFGAIADEYFGNYGFSFTNGLSLSNNAQNVSVDSIALKITNTQSSATVSPFQQQVVFDSAQYSQYEANSLKNIQFSYSNGTVVPSWLEGGNIAEFLNGSSISIPNSTSMYNLWHSGDQYTISVWVDLSSVCSQSVCNVFPAEDLVQVAQGCTSGMAVGPDNSTGFNIALMQWSGSGGCTNAGAEATQDQYVPYNKWEFLTVEVHYNPTSPGSSWFASCVGTTCDNSSYILDGTNEYTTGQTIIGKIVTGAISNLQIYNKTLSIGQLSYLNSIGAGGSPISNSNLVAWLPLAGNSNDNSVNGNNGAATNVEYIGTGASSTSTIYWLKIGSIPAASSLTIYMSFYPKSYSMFNSLNTGEAPQLSPVYGEYDNIGNVMNKGLEYQVYYDPSGTCDSTNYQNNVYSATLNNGATISSCVAMSSSTAPFYTSLGSSQDVNGATEPNVVINYQEGYSGGGAYPNPPVSNPANSWIIKAIGWAEVNLSTSFSVESDDGIGLGYSTSAYGGNGAYWLGGTSNPNNLVNEWHGQGATTYSSTISTIGTQRIELDYFEGGGGAYTALWSNNLIDYYSPSAPPNGVMPSIIYSGID